MREGPQDVDPVCNGGGRPGAELGADELHKHHHRQLRVRYLGHAVPADPRRCGAVPGTAHWRVGVHALAAESVHHNDCGKFDLHPGRGAFGGVVR